MRRRRISSRASRRGNGLGSILAGQVPDKSERRRRIEGEGLKSYCVNLGHTAVTGRNCITRRRSLKTSPDGREPLQCCVGAFLFLKHNI